MMREKDERERIQVSTFRPHDMQQDFAEKGSSNCVDADID